MRDKLWIALDDEDESIRAKYGIWEVAEVVSRHCPLGFDSVIDKYYRLTGYLLSGKIGLSGDAPHDASSGSAASTD